MSRNSRGVSTSQRSLERLRGMSAQKPFAKSSNIPEPSSANSSHTPYHPRNPTWILAIVLDTPDTLCGPQPQCDPKWVVSICAHSRFSSLAPALSPPSADYSAQRDSSRSGYGSKFLLCSTHFPEFGTECADHGSRFLGGRLGAQGPRGAR